MSAPSDFATRLNIIESRLDSELKVILIRLERADEFAKRIESTVDNLTEDLKGIQKNQKEGAAISLQMSQNVQLLMEAYGGKDGLEKMKERNKRVDASFGRWDRFFKTLWDVSTKLIAFTLIAALGIGGLVLLGVNLNSTMEIVPTVRMEAKKIHD